MALLNSLKLAWCRRVPFDHGKHLIEKRIQLPPGKVDYTNPWGVRFRLDLQEYGMKQIYLRGTYERNTLRHLLRLLRPGMTCVDVGANIGAYTLMLAKHLKQGRVIAFEPNPMCLRFLQQNIELNGFTQVQVVPMGLSDTAGTVTLLTSADADTGKPFNLGTVSLNRVPAAPKEETIELVRLDDWCREQGIPRIDLMKIDVEGHEAKVLDGAQEIIRNSPGLILVMEIDDNTRNVGLDKNAFFQRILGMGFRGYIPRGFPFGLQEITQLPDTYMDNIIFIRKG